MENLKIVQVGIGSLGQIIVPTLTSRKNLNLIGVIDHDPVLVGHDVAELCSIKKLQLKVTADLAGIRGEADAAILTTVSDIQRITPQIIEIVSLGIPVVTTCEELTFARETSPELASRIDDAAKSNGVAVLSTGVNPGFMMDTLPITLTSICSRVDSIKVSRIQDATFRRLSFLKKIGAGLSLIQFEAKKQDGSLRHVGLTESIHMIAAGLGWHLERTEESLVPVVSEDRIDTDHLSINPGEAVGVQQISVGYISGKIRITLVFKASVGESHPVDAIEIKGEPSFCSRIEGGINGDVATCAIVLNALQKIRNTPPGLHSMIDMPPFPCFH